MTSDTADHPPSALPLPIEGARLRFRLIEPDDAAYVFALRTDADFNRHLSAVTGTVADQRAWIESYKSKEAAGKELYFVIERLDDGEACGLVRLYEIEADRFTWGSWILDRNKPSKAALDSAVLVYRVGFDHLGKRLCTFDVRNDNARTIAFHERFGATRTGKDAQDTYFTYGSEDFDAHRANYLASLKAGEDT